MLSYLLSGSPSRLPLLTGAASLLLPSTPPPSAARASYLPGAGLGLFSLRPLPPSTVAALFPGIHHPPPPLPLLGQDLPPRALLSGLGRSAYGANCNAIGGTIEPLPAVDPRHPCGAHVPGRARGGWEANPSAIGHRANHAPGGEASLEPFWFLWRDVLPLAGGGRWHVPNCLSAGGVAWYFDEEAGEIVGRPGNAGWTEVDEVRMGLGGMGLRTTREVAEGEEMLFDYRLNRRGGEFPGWYRSS